MEHRIGDDELHEDDRFDLCNAKARCDKSNAGYDVDNDLGGYVNADFCVNAEYFNNAGQYDVDDEHDTVLVGQDSSKEVAYDGEDKFDDTADGRNDSANDNEVFWWDGWPQAGKNNGEVSQDIGKEKVELKETELLVRGQYALASDLIRLQHTGCWSTGLSLPSTGISDVVKGETVERTTCWTMEGKV